MAKKTNKPLEGVRCIVNTCEYHGRQNTCMANTIEVAPKNASAYEQTDCSTFKMSSTM